MENLRYLDTELLNCFQRSRGARTWIDIDFDSPDKDFGADCVNVLMRNLSDHNVESHVIETRSGFHVLIRKDQLHYNYTETVKGLDAAMKHRFPEKAEVVVNRNEMCPIPGVLSAGFEVRFVE